MFRITRANLGHPSVVIPLSDSGFGAYKMLDKKNDLCNI
jgi:hypothetical protein